MDGKCALVFIPHLLPRFHPHYPIVPGSRRPRRSAPAGGGRTGRGLSHPRPPPHCPSPPLRPHSPSPPPRPHSPSPPRGWSRIETER